MNIIQGGKIQLLAGAKVGETILVHLINGKIEKVNLLEIIKYGIEGIDLNLSSQPLTFYPFSAIIKIRKYNEIE